MERTEEDKITQTPAKVILGGKEYEIKPLSIKYSLPWAKKMAQMLIKFIPLAAVKSDDGDAFTGAINEIIVVSPEQLVEMFFEYARDLDRKQIEDSATSIEIINAFEAVLEFERPLFGMALRLIGKAMPEKASAPLSNS